jgi:hypothetical protein
MFFKTKAKKTKTKDDIAVEHIPTVKIDNETIQITAEKPKFKNVTYESIRQQIRELAYLKWEQANCPWGKDKEFWIEAEKELFGEEPLKHGGYRIKNNGSYVLICPINSEMPVEVQIDS